MHEHVHGLAPLFCGDQHPVGLLFGAVVAQPHINQVPGEAQIDGAVIGFLGERTGAGARAVGVCHAVGGAFVTAVGISGLRQQPWQHVELGDFKLIQGNGFFH